MEAEPEDSLADRGYDLLDEYDEHTRPFLEKHLPIALPALDRYSDLLEAALEVDPELKVGFVGESQVGKSTLLNALLGTQAVPTGGIGPLTAKPIHIVHDTQQSLQATYHDKKKLNQTRFAAEKYLARKLRLERQAEQEDAELQESELALAVEGEAADPAQESEGAVNGIGEELLGAIAAMFQLGDEVKEDPALAVDALRSALGQKPVGAPERLEPFADHIKAVAELIGWSETFNEAKIGAQQFREALKSHAAGWRSPLVHELEVRLRSDVLESVNFVDLPGVGTINDPAQEETKRFVQTGDALAVVVRNNGITEAVVNLLEKSEFLTRWIWSEDLENPPIHVVLVVTHLDNVAKDRHRDERALARVNGGKARARDEVFLEMAVEMTEKIRSQLEHKLMGSPAFQDLEASESESRLAVVRAMCRNLKVHCVSAPDAIELETGDEEEAYLQDIETTGIPALRSTFQALSQAHTAECDRRIEHCYSRFMELLRDQVERSVQSYEEVREVSLLARFRKVAEERLPSLRERMQGLHGRCQARLAEDIPRAIRALCEKAENVGLKKLNGMRRDAETLYYQSLNAALRRSGRWDNQGVDYPGLLTRTMVEAVANGWSEAVVKPVRATLKDLAQEDAQLSQQLLALARDVHPSLVETAAVQAYLAGMRAAAESGDLWSADQLEALKRQAHERLSPAVLEPIAAHCADAERSGRNRGTGAKRRIIQIFEAGGQAAIESAREEATRVLQDLYQGMYARIQDAYLSKYSDPLGVIYDAITSDGAALEEELVAARREEAAEFLRGFQERFKVRAHAG